ncbi:MAG: PD40 domain-containing protein [Candidatus Moranbacteria bacterium]|nr:PD40 domain-containing protein [Candidatus Moranbacteria bacterium]
MFIRKQVLIILALVLFGVAVIFAILNFKARQQLTPVLTKAPKIEREDYPADLQGKVYMTLRDKMTQRHGIYYLDLTLGTLEKIHAPNNCVIIGGELSPDGSEMAVSSNCGGEDATVSQIYSSNIKKESKQITGSRTSFKKEAVWSPDSKKIAFMVNSHLQENNNFKPGFDINTWNVFTSDLEGNEQFVSGATHPFFSPDGKKILALRKEGLFLFNLETGRGERVLSFDTGVSITFHLDLSDQKDRLVISNSIDRNITIFKINSWDTFKMEEIQKIETKNSYVSWPKFAPDNKKYLITEELFDDQSIKLAVYNLVTKEKHFIVDLSAYEHSALWVNDWR